MERKRLKPVPVEGSDYFPTARKSVKCIPSGCVLLDCVLGGGWARGRVVNIVGDKAVGKTLLAIEACANFARLEPKGKIYYREAEAAFDEPYAEELGLPLKRVNFGPNGADSIWDTVEDIFEDLSAKLAECEKTGVPALYIVDSLDALTSRAELDRKVDQGSYGLEKPKMMGKLFRQLVRRVKSADFCVIFISQVRDRIGIVFGEKHTRSGGKALDFYASQILWLSHIQTLTRTVGGVKRATAIRVKAKCKKNKIGMSLRDCEFSIRFGFGVDDVEASLEWLTEVKALDKLGLKEKDVDAFLDRVDALTGAELAAQRASVHKAVVEAWRAVEGRFAPARRKYG